MSTIFNRLQFVHHDEVFATKEEAYAYVINNQTVERPSLLAEPMVLLYESGDAVKGPNVILAIGSVGEGEISTNNRTFFIDTNKTEEEIAALGDEFADAVQALTIIPLETSTAKVNSEKTESGTNLSVDVKVAPYKIIDREVKDNLIQVLDDGLYAFFGIDFDESTGILKFTVNDEVNEINLPINKNVVAGWYDPKYRNDDNSREEAIVLKLADGSLIPINVGKLILEWRALGAQESTTPVILTRREVTATEVEHGMFDWQDVLEGDIRVASHIPDNIVRKDATGRYLYVKGTADNIKYKDGTVKDALDKADIGLSSSLENIIYTRPDGLFATAQLDYNAATNTLIFKYSNGETNSTVTKEIKLNSLDIFEDVSYDSTKEAIIIRYQSDAGQYKTVEIPVGSIITEWEVQNDSHTVALYRNRNVEGHDTLSADAKISELEDNILEEKAHELYVGGFASNIKFDPSNSDETVKDVLDNVLFATSSISGIVENEAAERRVADNELGERIDTVGLDYQSEYNKLVFTDGNGNVKEIQLMSKNLLKNIEYDSRTEEIVFTYSVDGSTEDQTIRVPVRDLIDEWTVQDSTTVKLTKDIVAGGGKDVLKAEAIICPPNKHDDNILVDDNGLYVSGAQIEQNKADIIEINDKLDNIEDVVNQAIEDAKLTFEDTTSIKLTKSDNNKVTGEIKVANADNNILVVDGERQGVFATARLDYNKPENKLKLIASNGVESEVVLGPGSIVTDISYDPVEKALVIKYKDAETGEEKSLQFGVSELFNEWDVKNPSENSAVELIKVTNSGNGENDYDTLSARVILSHLEDNLVQIDSNGLYVSGNAMKEYVDESVENATENLQREIDNIEEAVGLNTDGTLNERTLEHTVYISGATSIVNAEIILAEKAKDIQDELDRTQASVGVDEDGNFIAYENTNYIGSANTLVEADKILDSEIKNLADQFSNFEEEINNIENGAGLNDDGTYTASENGCFISAATSLYNADEILDANLCELKQSVIENKEAIAELDERKLDASAYTPTDLTGYATEQWVLDRNFVSGIVLNNESLEVNDGVVDINLPVDSELNSASTNPVENKAITDRINEIDLTTAAALNDLNTRINQVNVEIEEINTEIDDLLDCGEYEDGDVVQPDYYNKW